MKLLKDKKMSQAQMERSQEVREAFARKAKLEMRKCLDAQMEAQERMQARKLYEKDYWHKVHEQTIAKLARHECALRGITRDYQDQTNHIVGLQQEDNQIKLQKAKDLVKEEGKKVDEFVRQLALEQYDKEAKARFARKKQERLDALREIERRCLARVEEREREGKEFLEKCAELRRLEEEDELARRKRKIEIRQDFKNFGRFNKGIRTIESDIAKIEDETGKDSDHVYDCTLRSRKIKTEDPKQHFIALRKQMCDHFERRIQEDIDERKGPHITYNPFARSDPPTEIFTERRIQYKKDLDAQIEQRERIREQEERDYLKRLLPPLDDPKVIEDLAQRCEFEGLDYLPPHANWLTEACYKQPTGGRPKASTCEKRPSPADDVCCRYPGIYKPVGGVVCPPWNKRCHF